MVPARAEASPIAPLGGRGWCESNAAVAHSVEKRDCSLDVDVRGNISEREVELEKGELSGCGRVAGVQRGCGRCYA